MIYLALGSNLGDRRAHLDSAVAQLKRIGEVLQVSPYVETTALLAKGDTAAQPAYLNGAVAFDSPLEPLPLMRALRNIEAAEGRPLERTRWQPRTLDLDIVLWDARVIDTPELKVPHPEMEKRRFVLEPLAVIAPHAVHPVLNRTVAQLLSGLRSDDMVPGSPAR